MPNPHIDIKHFTGGPVGEELMSLYFQETSANSHKFRLFKGEHHIPTEPEVLSSGDEFRFGYNELEWKVTKFFISEKTLKAHGHWHSKPENTGDNPESGTFQAQGGGSAEGELKASASGTLK